MELSRCQRKLLVFLWAGGPLWKDLYKLERTLATAKVFLSDKVKDLSPDAPEPQLSLLKGTVVEENRKGPREAGARPYHVGRDHETLRKWQLGDFGVRASTADSGQYTDVVEHVKWVLELTRTSLEEARKKSSEAMLRRTQDWPQKCQAHINNIEEFLKTFEDERVRVSESVRHMGISSLDARKAIDAVSNRVAPLLPLAYTPLDKQEEDLKACGGLYLFGAFRETRWLQCAVQVTHVVEVSQQGALRAKLVAPKLVPDDSESWIYDGFVRRLHSRLYFVFGKRDGTGSKRDFVFIIATPSDRSSEDLRLFDGEYLTSGQDLGQATTRGRAVLWHRDSSIPSIKDDEEAQQRAMKEVWDLGRQDLPPDADIAAFKEVLKLFDDEGTLPKVKPAPKPAPRRLPPSKKGAPSMRGGGRAKSKKA